MGRLLPAVLSLFAFWRRFATAGEMKKGEKEADIDDTLEELGGMYLLKRDDGDKVHLP